MLLTIPEAAKILNRTEQAVRLAIREGRLTAKKIGRQWLLSSEMLHLKDGRTTENRNKKTPV